MAYVLSGFSDEYAPAFDEQIEGLQKLGMKYLELRFVDGVNVSELTDEQVQTVYDKLQKAGISVSSIGSPIGKIQIDEDFVAHLKKAERVFSIAKTFGCKYVRMFSFYLGDKTREECKDTVIERLRTLVALAEKYGVTLCHENEAKIYGEQPEECLALIKALDGKMRCVFDMGNFRLDGADPANAYELLKDYIEYFHIKDATVDGEIVPCGEGDAKIEEILKKHHSDKNVFVSLEPHLVAFTGLSLLAGSELTQKYSFANSQEAFTYASNNMQNILQRVNEAK